MNSKPAPFPLDEARRIEALERLQILDTLPEQTFDDVVLLAKTLCDTPIALVSLIDRERQWFKACIGLDVRETHRDHAFCAHAILQPDEVFEIEDTLLDPRFVDNALVQGEPHIRFYAGAPVTSHDGHALGTVCVIDRRPRRLDTRQRAGLTALARQAATLLDLREQGLQKERQALQLSRQVIDALADDEAVHAGFRQRQRIAAVGQFTSSVTHDLNNLLQAINASLQLMQFKADQPREVERLAGLGLETVQRGHALIDRLLAFARKENPVLEPLSVAAHVDSLKALLPRLLGRQVRLLLDLDPNAGDVLCDTVQFEAMLINLLVNARDALPGGGTIHVRGGRHRLQGDAALADGDYLRLQIEDDGCGMPGDVASRAFEPFFTTKPEASGTGLGLSQVAGFARRCNGTVRIDSQPGQGTTVTLLLPLHRRAVG